MKNAINLENLFINDIRELYAYETITQEYLNKISDIIKYEPLNFLIKVYREDTELSKRRLDKIGNLRDFSLKNGNGNMFKNLFDEDFAKIENESDLVIRHISIISFIEKLINYKLAIYRMISVYSTILGFEKPVRLIEEIIEEKVKTFCEFLYLTEDMSDHLKSSGITQN
ncbi:MAG TPA: DUF892 family protein [Ignavibacteria bacterium]|nr:DUF892 family protein [Ignavibacteria bacterium]